MRLKNTKEKLKIMNKMIHSPFLRGELFDFRFLEAQGVFNQKLKKKNCNSLSAFSVITIFLIWRGGCIRVGSSPFNEVNFSVYIL